MQPQVESLGWYCSARLSPSYARRPSSRVPMPFAYRLVQTCCFCVCKSCYYYICEDICVLCAISRGHMRLEVPAQLPVPHEHSTVRATPLSEKRRAASRVSLCKDVTARVLLFRVSTPTAYTAHCPTTPAQLGPHGLSLPRKRPIAALPRKRPIAAA